MFPKELNDKTNRILKNFNKRVGYNKTKTRGRGILPDKVNIKQFKLRYSDKSAREIEKQLKLYASFNTKKGLEKSGDNRLSKWEKDFFKKNRKKTIEFYDKEIADLERIIGNQPEFHLRLHNRYQNLVQQREELDKDLNTLTDSQIRGFRAYYAYAERSELVKRQGFRLYLAQLERAMKLMPDKYKKADREALLSKFYVLSENQFTEMVRNEDLIDSVYDTVDSPKGRGKYELAVETKFMQRKIDEIILRADELIDKYKNK